MIELEINRNDTDGYVCSTKSVASFSVSQEQDAPNWIIYISARSAFEQRELYSRFPETTILLSNMIIASIWTDQVSFLDHDFYLFLLMK